MRVPILSSILVTVLAVAVMSNNLFIKFPEAEDAESTIFCAIGDIPYSSLQEDVMREQIRTLPEDCEFVIHLGDMRDGDGECVRNEYARVDSILRQSPAPVTIVLGDNDWSDCDNPEEGLSLWREYFAGYENRHWNPPFQATREPGRDTSFTFEYKGVLYIALTITSVPILDQSEWDRRLNGEFEWTRDLVRGYRDRIFPAIGRVVLFVHAEPEDEHRIFFEQFRDFVASEASDTPFLYLHGDDHDWAYESSFLSQPNVLRISMSGEGKEPVTKFTVVSNGQVELPSDVFQYDRRLSSRFCNSRCSPSEKAVHHRVFGHCFESCSPIGDLKIAVLGWACGPC